MGIETVGEIADAAQANMVSILGSVTGKHLHALANNIDSRPVRGGRRRRSIGSQCALGRSKRSPQELDAPLLGLVDRVARRMRKAGLAGRTLTLRLRFGDYTRATRSHTIEHPTADTKTMLLMARGLLRAEAETIGRRGLTLIGITIGNLGSDGALQMALPLDHRPSAALDRALDEVRDRYGSTALRRATLAEKGPHFQPWLMPGEELER